MKLVVSIISLIVLALVVPVFFMPEPSEIVERQQTLPWNVQIKADGNPRVLGLTLNVSTLAEAKQAFGPDIDIAIVNAPGETGSIEAYVRSARAGFITGKLILVARADETTIQAMRERAAKTEYMESTTRKATPTPADLATALQLPVRSLSFIPSVNLDRAAIVERFGAPVEEIQANAHQRHLLYPQKGLDIIVDSEGKELLQYVAPREFAALVTPLRDAAQ